MNKIIRQLVTVSAAFAGLALAGSRAAAQDYHVAKAFPLGTEGDWDYLLDDSANGLLYVSRATHVMVVKTATGELVADIEGQNHNHGVALVPSVGRGFISDGAGAIFCFDLKTFAVLGSFKTEPDADGIIYDKPSNKLFVVSGDGAIVTPFSPDIDLKDAKMDPAIQLNGKPEFLVSDGLGKVFINLTDKHVVAVVDTKTMKVVDKWSTEPGEFPVSMALDSAKHRLVIGCRSPQKMIVMSADDGKILADLPIGAGADATFVDGGDYLAACRDGTLAVARETSPGKFEIVQNLATGTWAGTLGVDTTTHTVYLPTANFKSKQNVKKRTAPIPNTFKILVVTKGS